MVINLLSILFQSTLSARRATFTPPANTVPASAFQSTLSARRATFIVGLIICDNTRFQSTLSARRATVTKHCNVTGVFIFQSTLSARRATGGINNVCYKIKNFNPRSPRGERLFRYSQGCIFLLISIHALREESDACGCVFELPQANFNPRSPRGERHDHT